MQNREYQERAISFLAARKRALLKSAAGSGKTRILVCAIKQAAKPFDWVGVLVNTIEQRIQVENTIKEIGLDPTISLVVACAAGNPRMDHLDIVVCDECHHASAPSWQNILLGLKGTLWGVSATPFSGDWEKDDCVKALFGYPEHYMEVSRDEVKKAGGITEGVVIIHDLDEEGEFNEAIEALAFTEIEKRLRRDRRTPRDVHAQRVRSQFTNEAVIANAKRNAKVVELAYNSKESTLVLVRSIEHGQELSIYIPGSVVAFSRMGAKKRKAAIDGFRDGSIRVLIATSLADEGLDIKRASVLINVAGGRSPRLAEQRSGRVMRTNEDKEFGTVIDFADRGASLAHNQFLARARTYKKLGYTIRHA